MTYAEALDRALCYGWIDGRKTLRQTLLAAKIHTEAPQKRVVENQHAACGASDPGRSHDRFPG